MAKVLFVQANYDINHLGERTPWMPIALVELASFIREKGHDVEIFDRNLHYDNQKFIELLKDYNPDIIGMTCYTSPVIRDVKQVAGIVKDNSSALVIVGGIHATLDPKSLLDFPKIDYVVRGEGEYPLLEICELVDKKKIKNISKLKNINLNPMRPFIDLNDLPVADYDLLEVKKYPIATFYTSRGCPGKCRFCYNKGRALRFYNTDKMIETFTRVLDKYNIREFTIADDNFANMSQRTTRICEAISQYNPIFHIFLRVDQTQDKVMSELKKAGCWAIQFGFESGSQRMLDYINKLTTVEQNINAIKQCRKYKIFVDGSFMIGLPTETTEEMNETVDFIKKYKPDAVDIKIYRPYPSTEFYEEAIKSKKIKRPESLEEWEHFCDLKEADPNLSQIPSELLIKTVNELSKSSYGTYSKKFLLLIKNGHIKYAFFKLILIAKNKLGLRQDDQKTRKD
jgi:anaerobic magnesium-protoporphyrin IX monomethyl ester cyclase